MAMNHNDILITMIPDEYHLSFIGRLPDGRQLMLTSEIIPSPMGEKTRDFINTYIWDADGIFLDAKFHELGRRGDYDEKAATKMYQEIRGQYFDIVIETIRVRPFTTIYDGVAFGFIPETEDDQTTVCMMPGNCLMFYEPFNGEYDT